MNEVLGQPVSVLLPVCNEERIEDILNEWHADVLRGLPAGSELVIEDASGDGTLRKLMAWRDAQSDFPVRVFHRDKKDGYFNAAYRLYVNARCPLIFISDADGQYVPSDFWRLVCFAGDYDIVHGVKRRRNDASYRVFASRAFNLMSRALFGHSFGDINSVHQLIKRDVVRAILPQVRHMRVLLNAELFLRAYVGGYRIIEVDIQHRSRWVGSSQGLPATTYLRECWNAYMGLVALRREIGSRHTARV
jgi:glycosyltransferase involved in cell wall biosynthesis